MKRLLITFALVLTGLALFGQIPRIRLNQVQKDTVWGSVLISSPIDSNLTYSRDFYIGADTSLNFYGTILVAGGGGGGGSFVTTAILSDSLSNYILKLAGFGGDVTGTYDNIVVVDDSHNHVISNVDGLQTALDGKSNTGHTHVISDISGLQTALDGKLTSVNTGVGLSGSGTTGSPLVVDTAGTIVSKNFYFANLPAGGGGTVTSVSAGTQISGMSMTITNASTTPSIATAITSQSDFRTAIGAGTLSSEVDGSVTNEGSLSVGAGGANSSDIVSNTSGSTNVTISGGSNVTVTESGSTITIASTGGGGSSFNNLTEDGDTIIVAKHLEVDTTTLFVDAYKNVVGLGKTNPDSTALVAQSSVKLDVNGSIKSLFYGMETDSTNQTGGSYNVMSFRYSAPSGSSGNLLANFKSSNNLSTNSSGFFFQRSRGNLSAESGVLAEDAIGAINFAGALTTGGSGTATARVLATADADADATEAPTRLGFVTGGSASTRAERLTIKSDGKIGIGTTTPSFTFHVAAPTGSDRVYLTGTLNDGNELSTAIVANSREAAVGLYKPTDRNPSGFVLLESRDGDNVFLYTDSTAANNVFVSTNQNNVGTSTGGTLVGSQTSDIRLKTDLGNFPYGLQDVLNLNPVQFAYKEDYTMKRNIGFYAQEVLPVIPEAVYNTNEIINEGEPTRLGMQYVFLIPVLTKAIQEQQAIINQQQTQINELLQRIITLENK